MTLQSLYVLMLCVSLILLVTQLLVKQKQTVHLLFAVFCGSMAMVAAQELGSGELGHFAYLIAIGTCATCNCYWLVARALFRGDKGVLPRHLLAAVMLGVLMIALQGLGWADTANLTSSTLLQNGQNALRELITLTSSTVLMLTLWEGSRGLFSSPGNERRQQLLFLFSYGGAVLTCTVVARFFSGDSKPWLVAICATQIMLTTQCLIYWRYHRGSRTPVAQSETIHTDSQPPQRDGQADDLLAQQIVHLIDEQQQFLQPNLKVIDIARQLDMSEYRISQVMREQLACKNFNRYINALRIRYARALLLTPDKRHWSVLVIGLESGFASVGPFTRAFKEAYGVTPGQFRQNALTDSRSVTA